MTYRTVLLHLHDHARSAACAAYAARLARRLEARLVGLACHTAAAGPLHELAPMIGSDPIAADLRKAEARANARAVEFERQCALAGLPACETARDDVDAASAVVAHALGADLVVVGQPDPDDPGYREHRALVDTVLQECPRPVLVVPYAGEFAPEFDTVLIAWDDSVEAAHAATAALPLIARARAVHLIRLRHPGNESALPLQAGVDRATTWLACHGLEVQGRVSTNALPVGEALLSELADTGANLLVMGAWGSGRAVERLVGGATRTLVDSMTAPVLFAH
ncbi:MAG: universal stress protein [Burkholderiales bacterium]|nr:universal stress protein [Burkholderiales bacterium]